MTFGDYGRFGVHLEFVFPFSLSILYFFSDIVFWFLDSLTRSLFQLYLFYSSFYSLLWRMLERQGCLFAFWLYIYIIEF